MNYIAQKNTNDFLVCLPLRLAIRTHIYDAQTIEQFGDEHGHGLMHAQKEINLTYRKAGCDVRSLHEIGVKSMRRRKDGLFDVILMSDPPIDATGP